MNETSRSSITATRNDTTNYLQTKLENEYLILIKEIWSTGWWMRIRNKASFVLQHHHMVSISRIKAKSTHKNYLKSNKLEFYVPSWEDFCVLPSVMEVFVGKVLISCIKFHCQTVFRDFSACIYHTSANQRASYAFASRDYCFHIQTHSFTASLSPTKLSTFDICP